MHVPPAEPAKCIRHIFFFRRMFMDYWSETANFGPRSGTIMSQMVSCKLNSIKKWEGSRRNVSSGHGQWAVAKAKIIMMKQLHWQEPFLIMAKEVLASIDMLDVGGWKKLHNLHVLIKKKENFAINMNIFCFAL